MKTYQRHLESTLSLGEAVDPVRKPVFRSSAIFPVVENDTCASRILFMGYWLLKRHIPEIQLLCTLRSETGIPMLRRSIIIDTPRARTIPVAPLLAEAGWPAGDAFVGSLELEIFSTRDLVFPYPAFVLNYFSPDFVTAVHTAGRVYNDVDDLAENDEYAVPESGFDVLGDPDFEPFFAFVNGPNAYEAAGIGWSLTGANGAHAEGRFVLPVVRPYQTVYIRLGDFIDLAPLEGGKGTLKVGHSMRGFFPRMIAGNRHRPSGSVSITHSYYDSSTVADGGAYWARTSDSLHDSSIFVPYFAEGDEYTDLVFYPIYSPSAFVIDLTFHDAMGAVLGTLTNWMDFETSPERFLTLRLNRVVEAGVQHGERHRVRGINVVKNWSDRSRIPTRLKFGLNVGVAGRRVDLPTNICFNSELGNPRTVGKPKTFKWAPILNHGRSVIVVTNSSTLRMYDRPATIELAFYREADDAPLQRTVILPPFGQERIDLSRDDELAGFIGEGTGWVTVVADNPITKAWYFDFNETGSVGGDHSF